MLRITSAKKLRFAHSEQEAYKLVYFIANIKKTQMLLYMKYHFLKNFHQTTMPRITSSRRMITANMILFWNTLQTHRCIMMLTNAESKNADITEIITFSNALTENKNHENSLTEHIGTQHLQYTNLPAVYNQLDSTDNTQTIANINITNSWFT